jgi:DNA-directed RNA polymerase subunit M/transcription elongation factor TFIIS
MMVDSDVAEIPMIRDRIRSIVTDNRIASAADQLLADLNLLSGIPFTRELLTSTRIAAAIGPLRTKASDSEIRSKSEDLFRAWTDTLKRVPTQDPTGRPADEVQRKTRRELIYEQLTKAAPTAAQLSPNELSVQIEMAIWRYPDHGQKFISLMGAFADPKKVQEFHFAERLMGGELDPNEFAALTPKDLLTSAQRKNFAEQRAEAVRGNRAPRRDISESSLFACDQCHSRLVECAQLQLLSADEPITNILRCGECGHEWRET